MICIILMRRSDNNTCYGLWNRSSNSDRNIYNIAYNAINGKGQPTYLTRLTLLIDDVHYFFN